MNQPPDAQVGVRERRRRRPWWILFALGLAAVASVTTLLVVGGRGGVLSSTPTFPSLRDQPVRSVVGTIAYSGLGVATPRGKETCVEAIPASGGTPTQLFCVAWDTHGVVEPALRWLPDGRLEATSRDEHRWHKIVDVTTGAVVDAPWTQPTTSPESAGPQGQVVASRRFLGRLSLTVTSGGTLEPSSPSRRHRSTRCPLPRGVPPVNGSRWSTARRVFCSSRSTRSLTSGSPPRASGPP